jgi:hypothetical protein
MRSGVRSYYETAFRVSQVSHSHRRSLRSILSHDYHLFLTNVIHKRVITCDLPSKSMSNQLHQSFHVRSQQSNHHQDLLLGVRFTCCTNHKGITYFMNQQHLTGHQARWLGKISEFNFTVEYILGKEITVVDALSRMDSADEGGTVQAESEFVQHDEADVRLYHIGASQAVMLGTEARYSLRDQIKLQPTHNQTADISAWRRM